MSSAGAAAAASSSSPSPASDFRNVQPVSRDARRAAISKEAMEKNRLRERRGGFHKYEDVGIPTQPQPGTQQYMPESERFANDAAREEYEARQERLRRAQATVESRRTNVVHREEERWRQFESKARREEERAAMMAGTDKKNLHSVAYDPVTLEYDPTPAGEQLRALDNARMQRAEQRKEQLASRMNSTDYNPVTGAARR